MESLGPLNSKGSSQKNVTWYNTALLNFDQFPKINAPRSMSLCGVWFIPCTVTGHDDWHYLLWISVRSQYIFGRDVTVWPEPKDKQQHWARGRGQQNGQTRRGISSNLKPGHTTQAREAKAEVQVRKSLNKGLGKKQNFVSNTVKWLKIPRTYILTMFNGRMSWSQRVNETKP